MIETLRTRRSVRKYTGERLSEEQLQILKEAVLRSPSSRSINPWEFVFVDDPGLLEKLARTKAHGSSFLAGAALGIVVLGDETRSDVWVEDCSIASILVQLAAHALGLGSCWVQVRLREHAPGTSAERYIQDLLGIPGHLRVESVIAVGHPAEEKPGHPTEGLDHTKIYTNRHGG